MNVLFVIKFFWLSFACLIDKNIDYLWVEM